MAGGETRIEERKGPVVQLVNETRFNYTTGQYGSVTWPLAASDVDQYLPQPASPETAVAHGDLMARVS